MAFANVCFCLLQTIKNTSENMCLWSNTFPRDQWVKPCSAGAKIFQENEVYNMATDALALM